MSEWISVKDRLPEVIESTDGSVNSVLVYQKDGFECGSDIQVANTIWLNKQMDSRGITHWMPLPAPPDSAKEGEKMLRVESYFCARCRKQFPETNQGWADCMNHQQDCTTKPPAEPGTAERWVCTTCGKTVSGVEIVEGYHWLQDEHRSCGPVLREEKT